MHDAMLFIAHNALAITLWSGVLAATIWLHAARR
jgi:hypothetical protein